MHSGRPNCVLGTSTGEGWTLAQSLRVPREPQNTGGGGEGENFKVPARTLFRLGTVSWTLSEQNAMVCNGFRRCGCTLDVQTACWAPLPAGVAPGAEPPCAPVSLRIRVEGGEGENFKVPARTFFGSEPFPGHFLSKMQWFAMVFGGVGAL